MEGIAHFNDTHWELDKKKSESIEPLLKVLGVSWVVRKAAALAVPKQTFTVDMAANTLTLTVHGQETTVYILDGGERVMPSNNDPNVTFVVRAFPEGSAFKLIRVLAGKGTITETRTLEEDGQTLRTLIEFSSENGSESFAILRIFKRIDRP
eukprot:GILI01010703.1.p1 GENE.GILI01010703.1~~GILI01010703.1.p1  ORF type:complete len:152 (+),score=38.98 GILI01010703.1:86-541(+)